MTTGPRLDVPRIPPLEPHERTPRQQEVIDWLIVGPTANIYTTIARHPDVAQAMVGLGRALRAGDLSGRHREILILRTGWNCDCAYEFAQHRRIALEIGMTVDEIARIQQGPDAPGWDPVEAALLRAADELHADEIVADATWATLSGALEERQVLEATTLVGYYHLVSFLLNTLGVQLEDGIDAFVGAGPRD